MCYILLVEIAKKLSTNALIHFYRRLRKDQVPIPETKDTQNGGSGSAEGQNRAS